MPEDKLKKTQDDLSTLAKLFGALGLVVGCLLPTLAIVVALAWVIVISTCEAVF